MIYVNFVVFCFGLISVYVINIREVNESGSIIQLS